MGQSDAIWGFETTSKQLRYITLLNTSETTKRYFRVDRKDIAFLRFIVEAYDGIAVVRTVDPDLGLIVFHISPGCEADVELLLQDLKKDILIEPS